MLPDISAAVRLQDLDQRTLELTKEISALPKHITGIEKKLEAHQRKLDADRAALSGNQKERKRLEGEIQVQEQKISRLKDQMREAKTNEQYRAFQHEIEFCENEVRRFEDRILDLMGESEPLEKNVKAAESALKTEKAQVEREKADARDRTAVDKKALEELKKERAQDVAGIAPSIYGTYERVRKSRGGIALAEAAAGRCSACHMVIRLQFMQELKRDDQVMQCESCRRILVYNPPQAVEDLTGESAPAAP